MTSLSHPSPPAPRSSTRSTRAGRCPQSWYSDAGVAALERERIFARTWQYGGPAEQVATPGSFMATQAGHVPIVVTRDREGDAARLRQRLPPSRVHDRHGLRQPRDAAVPVPRVDVRARRLAAEGARSEREAGFDRGRLLAAPRLGRHVGAVPLRQPRPGRGAARRDARRAAGDRGAQRSRPLDARASTRTTSGRSTRTGRSSSRTTSSATTAPPPIPASAR